MHDGEGGEDREGRRTIVLFDIAYSAGLVLGT